MGSVSATGTEELGQRQRRLHTAVQRLEELLDEADPCELATAVEEALAAGSPHPETVRLILDRRRRARSERPPVPVTLPDDPKVRNIVVTPHDLGSYDPANDEELGS